MFYNEERLALIDTRYRDARSSYRRTKTRRPRRIWVSPRLRTWLCMATVD